MHSKRPDIAVLEKGEAANGGGLAEYRGRNSSLFGRIENIGCDQDDSIFAVIPMPMHSSPRLSRGVTRVKGLGGAIVTNDRVRPLNEINYGWSVLPVNRAVVVHSFRATSTGLIAHQACSP